MISISSIKSGKGPLPILWTRIIDPDQDKDASLETFELDLDKIDQEEDYEPKIRKTKKEWKALFYSKDFWRENPDKELASYKLPDRSLRSLAKKAINLR